MREHFSESEELLFKKLQAKRKKAQRDEASFLAECDKRKAELLERWGISEVSDKSTDWADTY